MTDPISPQENEQFQQIMAGVVDAPQPLPPRLAEDLTKAMISVVPDYDNASETSTSLIEKRNKQRRGLTVTLFGRPPVDPNTGLAHFGSLEVIELEKIDNKPVIHETLYPIWTDEGKLYSTEKLEHFVPIPERLKRFRKNIWALEDAVFQDAIKGRKDWVRVIEQERRQSADFQRSLGVNFVPPEEIQGVVSLLLRSK